MKPSCAIILIQSGFRDSVAVTYNVSILLMLPLNQISAWIIPNMQEYITACKIRILNRIF